VATPTQTYANHQYRPIAWNIAWLCAVVGEFLVLWAVVTQPLSAMNIGLALLGASVVLGVSLVRVFALRLQNRIIRTEMELRLTRLGRAGDLSRLSLRQLIALRFASDAELPALIDRAVAEQLAPDQIKRAVTSWQGDFLRT
jgi:hypothetical protein